MSRLVFDLAALRPIVEHALSASVHAPTFGQTPYIAPALWLVKDDGIYLMSNGRPRQVPTAARNRPGSGRPEPGCVRGGL